MQTSYLGSRQAVLRNWQNPDGGWGYFRGKASRLEPTAYATMVLAGEPAAERAWSLLKTWQGADGGWRPAAQVSTAGWGTALCVTLGISRNDWSDPVRKGTNWLVETSGVESEWLSVFLTRFRKERDYTLKAWPWQPGNSGWVEPTAHALVALKKAKTKFNSKDLQERLRMGEAQLLDVRSSDGGWNYGSREALGEALPSYPETTALGLLGLQGYKGLEGAFATAEKQMQTTPSPLARAWLTVAARLHAVSSAELKGDPGNDIMIMAVEALAVAEGNFHFLKTENW